MPPKKLSISRIRAESRVRSDDPDLNRSSSSNRARKRYRSVAAGSSSSNASRYAKRKRPPQPKLSARVLSILEDDMRETQVQNRFAPDLRAERQNVSYRPLTLTQKARRDGADFQVPTLASMCCSIVANCFDSLLPSRDNFDAAAAAAGGRSASSSTAKKPIKNSHTLKKTTSTRKRSKTRAFGAAPDSDGDQQDYVPSEDDTPATKASSRSTRSRRGAPGTASSISSPNQLLAGWTTSELHYLTRKTSEQLRLLSLAASFLLYKTLVEQAPQYLTNTIISTYFLPPILSSSAASSTASTAAKTHVWLPASIPLLSHDNSAAAFLVGHLTSAITAAREYRFTLSRATEEDIPLTVLPSRLSLAQPVSFALRSLQLHGLTRLQDATLARLFEAAEPGPQQQSILRLDTISLRGCIAIADRTVTAICRSTGSTLRYLNLDHTDITANSVSTIMTSSPDLQTLKLGYNEHLSDTSLQIALEAPSSGTVLPFSKLTNLRLRRCPQVGESGVAFFLKYVYSTLEVLDVSFTNVGQMLRPDIKFLGMAFFPTGLDNTKQPPLRLRKINLQEANCDYDTIVKLIEHSPNMDTLMLDEVAHTYCPDDVERLLQNLVKKEEEGGWRNRRWKRLHLRTLSPTRYLQQVLPDLLAIFPSLSVGPLDSPFFDKTIEYHVPAECKVQHLRMRSARLEEHQWQFLPQIKTLRTLDLINSDVPEHILKATIEANPFLEWIDLTYCKQMRISTRRNAFDLVAMQSSDDDADKE